MTFYEQATLLSLTLVTSLMCL